MVNKNAIIKRLEQIDRHLKRLAQYEDLSMKEFLGDSDAQDIVEYNLFQTVNHIIDIIQHIVVDENYGYPETAYDAAQIFYEKGFLTKRDLDIIKRMVGFRNIVGHDYVRLDKSVVFQILKRGQKDIRSITSKITKKFL